MSRTIRFRAWHREARTMLQGDNSHLFIRWMEQEGQPLELMQYTGLKDKNGVDIYEGDIWKRGGFVSTVEFEFSKWAFVKTDSSSCYEYPSFYSNAISGEIIGNIHENPELLTTE